MATEIEVIQLIGIYSEGYPNYIPKPNAARIYYEMLEEIPLDACRAGIKVCVANSKGFFPDPGQWRQAALDIVQSKNNLPSGMEAWGEVVAAFENVGMYREPKFSHTLIDNIVRQMGWQNLCTSENAMADRARFIDAYNASVNTYVSDTRMLPSVKQVADKYALQAGEMVKGLADKWSTK
jgi:hypothetical protein